MTKDTLSPPPAGHNRPPAPTHDMFVETVKDILTRDRPGSSLGAFIDAIFALAKPTYGLPDTSGDIFQTELFGFDPVHPPDQTHDFCAEMGRLSEDVIGTLIKTTLESRGDMPSIPLSKLKDIFYRGDFVPGHKPVKNRTYKAPDFFLGPTTVGELKISWGSMQNRNTQFQAGLDYRAMGYKAVFLHVGPNLSDADMRKLQDNGWDPYRGDDTIAYLADLTGINLRHVFQDVAADPMIRQRMEEGRRKMVARACARMQRDLHYGLEDVRARAIDTVVHSPSLLEMLRARLDAPIDPNLLADTARSPYDRPHLDPGESPPDTPGAAVDAARTPPAPDALAAHARTLCDAAQTRASHTTLQDILDPLDSTEKVELILRMARDLDDDVRADLYERL